MTKQANPNDSMKNLEPFSKALGKAAGQVWKIFVMRYVAKGISEIFLAGAIIAVAWSLLHVHHVQFMWIPLIVAGVFIYDAIQLLINPHYFAMNDVALRLKDGNPFGN